MAENSAQRDLLLRSEFILRKLPRGEFIVNVLIEFQFAFLDKRKSAESGDWFADRTRLEESFGCNWTPGFRVRHSVDPRPHDVTMVEEGDADSGHMVVLHPVRQPHRRQRLPFNHDG